MIAAHPAMPAPRPLALLAAASLLLAGCGMPRSGPYFEELTAAPDDRAPLFHVIDVDQAVAVAATHDDALAFSREFLDARPLATALLAPGETLDIRIWENVENGVFGGARGPGATPFRLRIEPDGRIFIPYAGSIRAAGRSIAGLRRAVTAALAPMTRDPQVEILRAQAAEGAPSGSARNVKVIGQVALGGVHEITGDTSRLLGLLAAVLGPVTDPAVMQVALRRDGRIGRVWLEDLYDDPALDAPLRPGDTVIVERDRRSFTALGAVARATRIPFPARNISVLDALGLVGGLNGAEADATGVFILRKADPEPAARSLAAAGRPDAAAQAGSGDPQVVRIAYIIDLTRPGGMFTAGGFLMRDGDVIYVTDAPVVRWLKLLNALAPTVNFAGSATALAP